MNDYVADFSVGVGDVSLVSAYMDGKVLSVKKQEIIGQNSKPSDWFYANLLINGEVIEKVTIAKNCCPEELELFTTDYSFGLQIMQEKTKQGNVKNYIKIVYIITSED